MWTANLKTTPFGGFVSDYVVVFLQFQYIKHTIEDDFQTIRPLTVGLGHASDSIRPKMTRAGPQLQNGMLSTHQ